MLLCDQLPPFVQSQSLHKATAETAMDSGFWQHTVSELNLKNRRTGSTWNGMYLKLKYLSSDKDLTQC